MIDELGDSYDIPPKTAYRWLQGHEIAPLLDGLDEVADKHRDACVDAINEFREAAGSLP